MWFCVLGPEHQEPKKWIAGQKAVGHIQATGWLCVLVVVPQGQEKRWKEEESWGQGPAKSNWAVGPEAGVGEAKGLWL